MVLLVPLGKRIKQIVWMYKKENVDKMLYYLFFVGVVQLLNKIDGMPFNKNDENLFEVILLFWHSFN